MIPPHAFALPFVAAPADIDELGHVNNAVWVQWIQRVATAHWAARADARDQAAYVWVVVRHEIDYHRPLLAGERAIAHSWVADRPSGAKFDRHVVFLDEAGRRLVAALTTWALIDRASGRPLRVPQALVDRFAQPAA